MDTFIVTTTADSSRFGLAYKIEMGPNAAEEWFRNTKVLLEARKETFVNESLVPNTTIVWLHSDGRVESEDVHMQWEAVNELLARAEYNTDSPEYRKQGRPERRVLVLTTSKERRTGSLVARQAF